MQTPKQTSSVFPDEITTPEHIAQALNFRGTLTGDQQALLDAFLNFDSDEDEQIIEAEEKKAQDRHEVCF